jgi:hypothetical protein
MAQSLLQPAVPAAHFWGPSTNRII